MGLLDGNPPSPGLLDQMGEYLRRSGRNLSELPGGLVDWLAGGAQAGAEPTLALMRGDAINEPFLPTADSGGRIGAIASALSQPMVPGATPAGALGVYGGRMAKTANLDKLAEAEKLAASGAGNEAVRAATGWFQGPDKQWRFEIPDQYSEYRPGSFVEQMRMQGFEGNPYQAGFRGTAGDLLEHNKLYDAYPQLRDATVTVDPNLRAAGYGGMYQPFTRQSGDAAPVVSHNVRLATDVAPRLGEGKSVLLHELQHAVQNIEGFEPGGTIWKPPAGEVEALTGRLQALEKKDAFDGLTRAEQIEMERAQARLGQIQADVKSAPDQYRRLAGEVEARDVQARMNMPNSQRAATAPYSSQGIPPEQMILRGLLGP